MAAVAAAALSVALYLPHVLRGGWYYDDWALIADLHFGAREGISGVLEAAFDTTHRPGYALVLSGMWALGGESQAPYLVMSVVTIALEALLLYTALRALRMEVLPSAAAAALLAAFPMVDSTRLWMAAVPTTIAVVLYLGGLNLGLLGLRGRRRRSRVALHATAAVLYVLAILTYDLVAPLVALSGVLYLVAAGRGRPVAVRWIVDCACAGMAVVYLAVAATERAERQLRPGQLGDARAADLSPNHLINRMDETWTAAVSVFERSLPLDRLLVGPFGAALLVALMIGLGYSLARSDDESRAVRRWGAISGLALLFCLAGLVFLLPANSYYVPREEGVGNRFGVVAAAPAMVLMTALTWMAAHELAMVLRRPRLATGAAVATALAALAAMASLELQHQNQWARSWTSSGEIRRSIRAAVPDLPPGSGLLTFRHDTNLKGDVPVFTTNWDLRGAVKLMYDDPTLSANPGTQPFSCGLISLNVQAFDPKDPPERLRYGKVWFVDVDGRRAERINGVTECRSIAGILTTPAKPLPLGPHRPGRVRSSQLQARAEGV